MSRRYVEEEDAFPRAVCGSAQREWEYAKVRILAAPAAAAGTGVVANATVPKWSSVSGEEYRREMRSALAHLRGEGATVVLVCSYEAGGIVAVRGGGGAARPRRLREITRDASRL